MIRLFPSTSDSRHGRPAIRAGRCAFAVVAPALLFALGCGGAAVTTSDSPPSPTVPPGLNILGGANQSDTVLAMLQEHVLVQAADAAGQPASGTWVVIRALPEELPRGAEPAVRVCRISDPDGCASSADQLVENAADALGKARFRVKLGKVAGVVRVAVSVPALGMSDTLSFTVRAGTATQLALEVPDSALYVGNTYAIGGALRDAHGNAALGPPVTYAAIGSAAEIEGDGTFRGLAVGLGGAVVQSGARTDTAWVTVTPRGSIVAYDVGDGIAQSSGVAKIEMDGSGYRMITRTRDTYYGTFPNWTADRRVIFESSRFDMERAFVTDTLGNVLRLTPDGTPTNVEVFNATARDGSVFVTALTSTTDSEMAIWRVAAPGAQPVRVGPNPADRRAVWKASLSPASDEIAFSEYFNGSQLSIMRVADATVRALPVRAEMPRWAPSGEWIVFNDDSTLYRIRPDGTGRERVGPVRYYSPRADWSPDGRWVIARTRTRLELIDVATGATLALPFGKRLIRPAWRE